MHRQLPNGMIFGLLQSLREELIRLRSRLFRGHIIGALEIDGIHFCVVNELQNLHGSGCRRRDLLQLFVIYDNVFALARFVTLHDFAPVNGFVFLGAIPDFFDSREILAVQHVELYMFGTRRSEESDWKSNQSKTHKSLPHNGSHFLPP